MKYTILVEVDDQKVSVQTAPSTESKIPEMRMRPPSFFSLWKESSLLCMSKENIVVAASTRIKIFMFTVLSFQNIEKWRPFCLKKVAL